MKLGTTYHSSNKHKDTPGAAKMAAPIRLVIAMSADLANTANSADWLTPLADLLSCWHR